ncbi:Disease resistance protein [Corchorus olitorius]|uniref:Disease resistance protein n=1 Tax=Corchorus olitorius TaxID=93759 RepID=A0A1R3I0W8_9ROSI|nr:Disease resistance protein [Corchorus olitorius]
MEFATAAVGEIAKEVSNSMLDRVKRHAGYILDRKKNVADLKAKVEDLNDKRERVEHDVQAAKRNEEEIAADVNRWLERVGEIMEKNAEEVKALEDQAMNRCFMCCPNVKSYHQLGKKAEEHAGVIEKLLQAKFDSVGYRRAPELIVKVPGDYYNFQSRSNLLEGIMNALTNPDVKVIGLHGLPGVGKTILVNVVARKAWEARMFDEVVIATVSHNPNIRSIQEEIAEQLGLRFDNVKKESGRAKVLSQRLSGGKKILVILDDIWDKMDLDDIGISFKDDKNIARGEKAGSTIENISGSSSMDTSTGRIKILLTSRRSDVMDQMNAEMKFECEYLSREEAMELFASIVGSAVVTNLAYNSKANQLVEKCGGLPVAVSTIANAMKNTSPDVWENALIELKRLNPENIDKMRSVYSIIELSYQLLKSEEAQSFLELCALEGQASNILLSDLLKYGLGMQLFKHVKNLEEARIRLSALVHKLKASSLLLSGKYDETVKMHDLVRDVSLSIVSKEKQMIVIEDDTHFLSLRREGKLANCTAISLPRSDVHQLPSVLECPKLKLLLLFSKDKFQLQVPDLIFEKTNDLRVLDLTGMHFPSLPSSFPCLTNLRTLCLDQCKLGTITSIAKLKKLDILSFLSSEIMQLPNEIGELTELRMLDLSNCSNLEVIPANTLSKLSCLEELYMGNSFDRWDVEGNARLTELRNLKHLTTLHVHVRDAQFLPEDVFPETLGRYRIFLGDMPWDWVNKHKYSRTLKLKVTTRINLDREIRALIRKAEELYVDELEGFRSIIYELDDTGFQNLKNLQVKNNSEIQCIISSSHGISSEAFPLVESLLLYDLINLKKIFHGQIYSGCFRRLRTIEVRNCDSLKNLFSLSLATHFLQQLQEIEVSDCSAIVDILGADRETANQEAIVLGELQSITLQSLPNLVSFYFGEEKHSTSHHGQVASTLSSVPLFSKKIEFPKLQKLKLCSINIESIWHSQYQLQTSIQNLTSLIIEGCDNLKHILSYSMANWLQQLQVFEIINCKQIREIIATEETTVYGNRTTSFFPCLKILRIEQCPELKGFINKSSSKDISSCNTTEVVLFSEEVAFPNLERLTISHLRNVKQIWYHQPQAYSCGKLKDLTVEYCNALLNVFTSSVLGAFQSLEMLKVTDCSSLEEVFDIKETCSATMQLRRLYLDRLPKLKHVWNKDPHGNTISFKDLRHVEVLECWSLKSVFPFSIAKGLQQLQRLDIERCGVEEIISKNINSEGSEQEIRFEFNQLLFLQLWDLPYLKCFYPGMHNATWPALKWLWKCGCEKKIKIFGKPDDAESQIQQPLLQIDEVIPRLEEVSFSSDDISMICAGQFVDDFFCHIKELGVTSYLNESAYFPFGFLQRFSNLRWLGVYDSNFKELSHCKRYDDGEEKQVCITLPKISHLRLRRLYKITHLWNEDSPMGHICSNLETLQVWECDSLISLGSSSASFQNLTTLYVCKCNGIAELITSSKAQSLVNLVTMKIRECEMMEQVVASNEGDNDDDEAMSEITFPKLECLKLDRLQSLKSFCSGNYTFKFPSLEQVFVRQCPSMKIFCHGALSTPRLRKVQLKKTNYEGRWGGDLNATIQQIAQLSE